MPLTLAPMTVADYADWMDQLIPDYAAEKVTNGSWAADKALQLSRESMDKLLPQGLATTEHFLHTLMEQPGGRKIGYLWFAREGATAYLYDISIHADCRRQGFGRQAMHLLEETTAGLGYHDIKLHVFGQNQIARELYTALGYETTDLSMRKLLVHSVRPCP